MHKVAEKFTVRRVYGWLLKYGKFAIKIKNSCLDYKKIILPSLPYKKRRRNKAKNSRTFDSSLSIVVTCTKSFDKPRANVGRAVPNFTLEVLKCGWKSPCARNGFFFTRLWNNIFISAPDNRQSVVPGVQYVTRCRGCERLLLETSEKKIATR